MSSESNQRILSVPVNKERHKELLEFIVFVMNQKKWSEAKVCRLLMLYGMDSMRVLVHGKSLKERPKTPEEVA